MSKIRPTLAIILAVFVFCLSACGESKETKDTGSSSAPLQDASSTVEASLPGDSSKSEESANETSRHDTAGVEDNGTRSDDSLSGQGSTDSAPSPEKADSGDDSRNDKNSDHTEPENTRPTAQVSSAPQENDNAEVDFNDH